MLPFRQKEKISSLSVLLTPEKEREPIYSSREKLAFPESAVLCFFRMHSIVLCILLLFTVLSQYFAC